MNSALVDDGGKQPHKDAKGKAIKPGKAGYEGDWVWEYDNPQVDA